MFMFFFVITVSGIFHSKDIFLLCLDKKNYFWYLIKKLYSLACNLIRKRQWLAADGSEKIQLPILLTIVVNNIKIKFIWCHFFVYTQKCTSLTLIYIVRIWTNLLQFSDQSYISFQFDCSTAVSKNFTVAMQKKT